MPVTFFLGWLVSEHGGQIGLGAIGATIAKESAIVILAVIGRLSDIFRCPAGFVVAACRKK